MIGAVILAAGLSKRMGCPKLLLPWGKTTVIGQVVSILSMAGISEILVVAGGVRREIELALQGTPARLVLNPRFENSEMIDSLQVGISHLSQETRAVLVVLGDQPQIQLNVVQEVLQAYQKRSSWLIVPSYKMKRGHPWLADRSLWEAICSIHPPLTLRDFLENHVQHIKYLPVDSDTILRDLDTPGDYVREKPVS